jgi:chromatin assembly factor 1 subunit A
LEKQKLAEERRIAAEEKKRLMEEQQKLKMEEKAKKEEEKKMKEDERIKKMEEKKKIQEEKQRQEDEKKRQLELQQEKARRQSAFMLNFVKKSTEVDNQNKTPLHDNAMSSVSTSSIITSQNVGPFLPFQLKPGQEIANPIPSEIKENFCVAAFDCDVHDQNDSKELYLQELRNRKPYRVGRRYRLKVKKTQSQASDNDVQEIDSGGNLNIKEELPKFKVKFLWFHENLRPPYFGTYNKRSKLVTGRRPFGEDPKWLNYDVDSDEEWDEGGPGESLKGSDDETGDPEDDYEIDNDFMVPHGYLSDEEAAREEEGDIEMGKDGNFREKEMITRKNMKVKLLKPVSIGCLWSKELKLQEYKSAAQILLKFKMVFNGPIDMSLPRPPDKKKKSRKPKVPKEAKTPRTPKLPV